MNIRKKKIMWIRLGAILLFLIILHIALPKYILRYFYWNFADIGDGEKFPKVMIHNNPENQFHFFEYKKSIDFEVPPSFQQGYDNGSFDAFLEANEVTAFLIIRNDTLLYEKYFGEFDQYSQLPSFSVSKSFVSALTGIAIAEGYIPGTEISITTYLPELGEEFIPVTLEDLLNMRSGIDFEEGYSSPFADMPKYYYGTELEKYIRSMKIREFPDKKYDYISVNTLLIGLIIQRSTQQKLNEYLQEKIWIPLGMESDAYWNIDSEENQTIKSFCCINAIARDFAKFGRLYLQRGNWDGKEIIPEAWINRSLSILNDSRDSQGYPYTYQWRVLDNGAFFAKGILGQYVFVYPAKKMIAVRLGRDYADIDWAKFFLEISDQI